MKVRYFVGKDYPHVCSRCQASINQAVLIVHVEEQYADDQEGPIMWVYDNNLMCGGHTCTSKSKEFTPHEE